MEEKKEKRILQIELDDDLNEFPMQELKTLFNKQSSYTTKIKHLISNNFYEDKKILFVITTMFLMVQGASAWSGSGTSSGDPYLIASPADWETLATSNDDYSGKFFKLTADITIQIAKVQKLSDF